MYSINASSVWGDLKERFNKFDCSRIFQIHKVIATITQGTSSISAYFSKLRLLWAQFHNLAPIPGCDYAKSREFVVFIKRLKLLQFLMGLNESYELTKSQLLMMVPVPTINKAYSMLMKMESQRSMENADAREDLYSKKVKGISRESEGLYLFLQKSTNNNNNIARGLNGTKEKLNIGLCHKRLGYASTVTIKQILGLGQEECKVAINNCTICPLARHTRLPFHNSTSRSSDVFELLHIDVWGPYNVPTLDGNKIFLTIMDDCSRTTWLFLLKLKSDVIVMLRNFFSLVKTQLGKTVKMLRSDNGGEFINTNCFHLFQSLGIIYQRTCVYTPQWNRIAERKHIHILEIARPVRFQGGKSPYKGFYKRKSKPDHLRVIRCLCFAKKVHNHDKFAARATATVMWDTQQSTKGTYYMTSLIVFFVNRDVHFKEHIFPFKHKPATQPSLFSEVELNNNPNLDYTTNEQAEVQKEDLKIQEKEFPVQEEESHDHYEETHEGVARQQHKSYSHDELMHQNEN
ncbi:uncharacterized protein LOC142177467 [Nicotiana tabacum]|uniref:Uncharacterized protein LOC142177467 n=1 Tax=Nicotiana tabacum TaxID=4097 RepID=A0AC58TYQ3_TOBAC